MANAVPTLLASASLFVCIDRGLRAFDLELGVQCPGERGGVRGGVRRDALRFEQRGALWSTRRSDADPAVTGFVQAMCGGVAELQAADARPRETFAVRFGDGVAGIEQRGVDDRGIDELAFAGAVAVTE